MAGCSRCGKRFKFFEKRFKSEDEDGNPVVYCFDCNDKLQKDEHLDLAGVDVSFDSGMKERFRFLIYKFREGLVDLKPPDDPLGYSGTNCWVCLEGGARWYKGFRRLCSDCVGLLEGVVDDGAEVLSGLQAEKRVFFAEEIKKAKQEIEKVKQIELEKKRLREKNSSFVAGLCEKYLSGKDIEFKNLLLAIYHNNLVFSEVREDSVDNLRNYFVEECKLAKESSPMDYDRIMSLEKDRDRVIELTADLVKIRKLLDKKNVTTNYIQIFDELAKIAEREVRKAIEEITIPAHRKISKITTSDKRTILKEFLKLLPFEPGELVISDLFDKFNLITDAGEIAELLVECKEEIELEEFEKNLGSRGKGVLGDFMNLDGRQFEEYLKELFSILGYQVVRTKLTGDQGADLIIKKDGEKTVIQAKRYTGSVTNRAVQEVVASKKHYGADNAMVITTGRFTKSAIELANSNQVELWDGEKLRKVVSSINNS